VSQCFDPSLTLPAFSREELFEKECEEEGCENRNENWMCVGCYQLRCGRYANAHALSHFIDSHHPLSLSLADLSFWCYKCESYIVSEEVWEVFSEVHRIKFGVCPGDPQLTLSPHDSIALKQAILVGGKTERKKISRNNVWHVEGLDPRILENKLLDRILGCIYGTALGDAYGLATEFLCKETVNELYGDEPVPFPEFKTNRHNERWVVGDWTDDTDQMILILESIIGMSGKVSELDFALRLKRWINRGFEELGDQSGMGLGFTVANVVNSQSLFLFFLLFNNKTAIAINNNKTNNKLKSNNKLSTTKIGLHNVY